MIFTVFWWHPFNPTYRTKEGYDSFKVSAWAPVRLQTESTGLDLRRLLFLKLTLMVWLQTESTGPGVRTDIPML